MSRAHQLATMPHAAREMELLRLTPDEQRSLLTDWQFWARPSQLPPLGDWNVWLALAGRGFGKTRLGSEWVRSCVYPPGSTPLNSGPSAAQRVALVAETAADARDVMVRGVSGILATHPKEFRPRYVKGDRRLEWPCGAVAATYSAEEPDQLRGPEHDLAWSDELAKWRYAQETWDMLQFGLRIGTRPRQLVTTTPRPIPIVRDLMQRHALDPDDVRVTRGSTYENFTNLAPAFIKDVRRRYEGTRLGRQELRAEILDDAPGALWTRAMLERRSRQNPTGALMAPDERLPDLARVIVAVDPSGTNGEETKRRGSKDRESGDDVGIVVAARGSDDVYYVLEDATVNLGPAGWARRAVQAYETWRADLIVGERNFGGAMVEHTIRTVRRSVPYREVVASRGKVVRAQPVAALYEQGRVRHIGQLSALEDQMCAMTQTGYLGKSSPDRVDALVWALTELEFGRAGGGGVTAVRGLG